jgi:hypothetical protein
MIPLVAIPLLVAMLALSSCVLSGKDAARKVPATPTPPVAATAAKPPAPPPPLSTPQTEIQLPPPQAISAAALATIPSVREELPAAEETPAAKPPAKTKPPATATTPKPEQPSPTPAAEAPSAVQGPVPPVTTPAEEQPRLTPVYTEEERRRIWGELEKRKTEIEGILRTINPNRMSADQKNVVDRIHSFITLAEDTARRGDFRSADALSERAVILAKELASGR